MCKNEIRMFVAKWCMAAKLFIDCQPDWYVTDPATTYNKYIWETQTLQVKQWPKNPKKRICKKFNTKIKQTHPPQALQVTRTLPNVWQTQQTQMKHLQESQHPDKKKKNILHVDKHSSHAWEVRRLLSIQIRGSKRGVCLRNTIPDKVADKSTSPPTDGVKKFFS